MKVRVEKPKELKEGDIVINDYGLSSKRKVYLSRVERVIDDGASIIVGTGGHAHRVPVENILAHVVGQAQEAHAAGDYIVMRDDLDVVIANGGGAILAENFTEWYNRTHLK